MIDSRGANVSGGIGGVRGPVTEDEKERMDLLNKQNEKLTKKILKLSKKMQEISNDNQQHIEALEREIARKAEKESLLESQ